MPRKNNYRPLEKSIWYKNSGLTSRVIEILAVMASNKKHNTKYKSNHTNNLMRTIATIKENM